MAIEFGALPGVLFSPTETFERLKKDANLADGLKLYFTMAIIGLVIAICSDIFIEIPKVNEIISRTNNAYGNIWMGGLMTPAGAIASEIFVLLIAFGIFLAIVALTSWLTGAISGKGGNFNKTAGLMSYTGAAFYLFIMLPLSIISMLMTASQPVVPTGAAPGASMMALGIVVLIAVLLVVIWEWLIAGRAAATAVGGTWGAGIAGVLLAIIILAAIAFAVVMVVGVALWQMGVFSPSGMAII